MIPATTLAAINDVREAFLGVLRELPQVPSFKTLCQTSPEVQERFGKLARVAARPHVASAATGQITCAILGSSGHGKTTVLDEMFPSLSARGWLETDVTDTTSQALRLEHAPPGDPSADTVTVRSWQIGQLKRLLAHDAVVEQNERDGIEVTWLDDRVVVDGADATLDPQDLATWRFPRRVELQPFTAPMQVPGDRAKDRKFIRALTVKEQSAVLDTGPVLEHEGRAYDALQLRALVESVDLKDDFEQVLRWAEGDQEQARKLTFVDTPGLGTSSVAKDEVLRHGLGRKSIQLAIEQLKGDHLDVVIHLVLCGQKSQFDLLWTEIERECGRAAMDSLAERLVLAINGTNLYFTNPDLRAKYTDAATTEREGDHFAATLEDNVLQRMSPRGNLRPARICFLDSRRIVEGFGLGYGEFYERHRATMEGWAEPGGVGHDTLERLGALDDFRANIDALADPDDRGQGFLMGQVLDLIAEQGERILTAKHLLRTGLVDAVDGLRDLLAEFYDRQGQINTAAAREALASCMAFLPKSDPLAIEKFAAGQIDQYVDGLVPDADEDAHSDWVVRAFSRLAEMVGEAIREQDTGGKIPAAIWTEFGRYYDARVEQWTERWGYSSTDWPPPPDAAVGTRELLGHCLRRHAREILWQLVSAEELTGEGDGAASFAQSDADRDQVAAVLRSLETAKTEAARLQARTGATR